jgi:two-component sensor histidine kinase
VLESRGSSVPLRTLLETAVTPFGRERFVFAHPIEVAITPELAPPLALLFYEMATNALKYGALSGADGRVLLDCVDEEGLARLTWCEMDGPAVVEPTRQGFGTRLLSTALAPFGGRVERRLESGGARYDVYVPTTPMKQGPGALSHRPD